MTKKKTTKKPLVQKLEERGIKKKALRDKKKRTELQNEWVGIGKSVPYSKLPKDTQKQLDINGSRTQFKMSSQRLDTSPADTMLTKEVCDKHLKSTGQLTDEEVKDMALKGNWKQLFTDYNTFAEKIPMDDVPFDQMMAWVTTLISGGSENKSFDDVIKKFFNFHLGQLDIKSLLSVQYDIEKRIKKLVMDEKQEEEEKVYKIG